MDNRELVIKIIDALGGKGNILKVENCMTRLRVNIENIAKMNLEDIKAMKGILGVVQDGTYIQIIVGPGKSKKMCDEAKGILGLDSNSSNKIGNWEKNKQNIKNKRSKSKINDTLKIIGEIFIPLLPAIIAAGIFNGIAGLITNLQTAGSLSIDGTVDIIRQIFSLIGGAFLGYFAIFTGVNTAIKFGATPALGGMIGAINIMPAIDNISKTLGLYNEASPLDSILRNGKGGILGVILGVIVLAKIEKIIRKKMPDVLDIILTPLITLLISTLIFIFVIMPISGVVSDGLMNILGIFINSSNTLVSIISGYILAMLFLPMVLLGLHHGLIPIYAIQLEQIGGVSLFPVLAMAGAGQVGASIAIYFKAKKAGNKNLQGIIAGALPAGILGIGEPLIYGVTLPLGKPFITAGLGAGFGGAYVMMTNVLANSWGPSGIVAIPLMHTNSMLNFTIGILISYVAGFIITQVFMKEKDVIKNAN